MGTIEELFDLFQHLLVKLCWHVLVMRNQFREYRHILNIQSPIHASSLLITHKITHANREELFNQHILGHIICKLLGIPALPT
jgi:hypothetical protein